MWPSNQWPSELLIGTARETARATRKESAAAAKLSLKEVEQIVLKQWLELMTPAGTA